MKNKKKITILYIGNNLSVDNKYVTMMDTLSNLLKKERYEVIKRSNNKNKFLRLISMCWAVFSIKSNYILIDTFSTQNFYYAYITSQIARFLKRKYIPILHGGNLPQRIDKSKKMANQIFNNSYKNVAPSLYLKTELENRGYKVDFIPNVIEVKDYNFKERKKTRERILWVRAFRKLYNPTMAIETLKLVKKKYPNACLCMVGPVKDESFEETQNLVKQYNLQDSVEFTGLLEKKQWCKKAEEFDIFINTTNIDNTPVSVIEAMALGLIVISTNAGGLPYLIDHNIDGVIVNKNDIKGMSKAIEEVLEKEKNINLIKNAREKALSFSWDNVKNKWLSILN